MKLRLRKFQKIRRYCAEHLCNMHSFCIPLRGINTATECVVVFDLRATKDGY